MLLGVDVSDPGATSEALQRKLVLFGRYGITIFALSGIDIALWDLKAKAAGVPVAALLGAIRRRDLPAYASLVRYGDAALAATFTAQARDEGYDHIKLHEISREAIAACDAEKGRAALMMDANCAWEAAEARNMAAWLSKRGIHWLEEPTFPPEDFAALAALPETPPLSCGENLCTRWQFAALMASGAVRYPQPSVTKVGGFSEVLKIMAMAEERGVRLMPHSPYFGPGYLATLQIGAALREEPLFEYLYVWPEAWIYPDMPHPENGRTTIPNGPGLGMDPDLDVLERFRVA